MDTTKKRIVIICGGRSGEHEVSLVSAASVLRHLDAKKYSLSLICIDHDGSWWLQNPEIIQSVRGGAPVSIEKQQAIFACPGKGLMYTDNQEYKTLETDIVFPVLHGTFGEDGTLQGMLEILDLPYVGCTVLGSALGMDKETVKRVWIQGGLPVVPFKALERRFFDDMRVKDLWQETVRQFGDDVFIKPSRCGSSVGISRAKSEQEFKAALDLAFKFDTKLLIEPSISAREIEVSVLGNEFPQAFVPGEIVPSHVFYDYQAKYKDPDGASFIIPAAMSAQELREAKELAVKAFTLSQACGLARVDFFLDKKTGKLLLNEINTMPGFTSISMFPRMCEADGLPYPALLDELISLGFKEYQRKSGISFSYED